jgi:hypothetical protein
MNPTQKRERLFAIYEAFERDAATSPDHQQGDGAIRLKGGRISW